MSRRVLLPFSALYGAGVARKNRAYDRGARIPEKLAWPVVSVGNLSTGGAGKTPFTAELARLLQQGGVHVDILSRGYGRRSRIPVERVPEDSGNAQRFGDEPLLLARATGAPVYVGASRYAAGMLAECDAAVAGTAHAGARATLTAVHLLDDGFQHRQLARSADIVLLHPRDARDALLPAGRLRESLEALERADFLVLRDDDETTLDALRRAAITKPVWRVRRVLSVPRVKGPVVAFAAIAHPEEFFSALRKAELQLTDTFAFRDHHRFTPGDMRRIAKAADGAAAVVTTEKDMVRITGDAAGALARGRALYAPPLRVELVDAPLCLLALRATLAQRWAPRAMRE